MISAKVQDPVIEKFIVGPIDTNCYVIHDPVSKKGALIDPGFFDQGILDHIEKKGIHISFIINTHGHIDHILANAAYGFPVMIHTKDEPYLHDDTKNLSAFLGLDFRSVRQEKLLCDGDVLQLGGIELEVLHTPGHTPGGISLRCGNVLFSGDTLFREGVGRTDRPGGNSEALLKSIKEKLLILPDGTRVLPGHGPETTIGHEKKFNPFIECEDNI